jgi:hypothetical protein
LHARLPLRLVTRAKRLRHFAHLGIEALFQERRVDYFAAFLAADNRMGDYFIPAVLKHVLELDRMLRTYSPAGGAPGAPGHVVKKCLNAAGFFGVKGACGTVLNTGQTAIAFFVHLEVDHRPFPGL